MPHIDTELGQLKTKLMEMWDLVEYQMQSGQEAFINSDYELADKVIKLGKKVNRYDIKIDRLCENFMALYTPVAVDLRKVLAILKINANLERIGDTAEGISMFVKKIKVPLDQQLVEDTKAMIMYEEALAMMAQCRQAFIHDDTDIAKQVIKRDKVLNKIYRKADEVAANYMKNNPDNTMEGLMLYSVIKKLERVGDQITNIAEEIIFYENAKVVRHKFKRKKKE
jgi:phosphate transport system protein